MLFEPQQERFPDLYPWADQFVKAMRDGFWTVDKFTFDADIIDFTSKLSPAERALLTRAFACVAQIEVKVKRFWARLGETLDHPAMNSLGITMAHVEDIHDEAYARLIEVLGMQEIFNIIDNEPAIANRIKYLNKYNKKTYNNQRKQFVYSLILFTLFVENVSLFTQFYTILFINREDGVMKDAAQQVKYTRVEEMIHAQAGIKIIQTLREEYPELFDRELELRIYEECREAQEAEYKIIDYILGDYSRPGLSRDILRNFIDDRLNQSLIEIGYQAIFEVDNQLLMETEWMEQGTYAPIKFDFFHGENTEYLDSDMARIDNFNFNNILETINNYKE